MLFMKYFAGVLSVLNKYKDVLTWQRSLLFEEQFDGSCFKQVDLTGIALSLGYQAAVVSPEPLLLGFVVMVTVSRH